MGYHCGTYYHGLVKRRTFLGLAFAPVAARLAHAATWVDAEVTCPVCDSTNVFQVPGSYGTYVYYERSRFQYVFWPSTTDKFLYTCRRCHLSAYLGDFAQVPADKVEELASMLEREASIEGNVLPYYNIPMTTRLPIAERVYRVLGRDDEFWCEFRRIEGYHLEAAGQAEASRKKRLEALGLARRLPRTKQTAFIIASMSFFTGDRTGSEVALKEAEGLRADSAELEGYLTDLIGAFRKEHLEGARVIG